MNAPVPVRIHPSQFPERVAAQRERSFAGRRVEHKFHYESHKQTQRWLEVYRRHCPFVGSASVAAIYDDAFCAIGERLSGTGVEVIGLGCGPAEKDARLLSRLADVRTFHAWDVSVPLLVDAVRCCGKILPVERIHAMSVDLGALAADAGGVLPARDIAVERVFTFFGMLPNFESAPVLRMICGLMRPGDWLLMSANLAPGTDYAAGVRAILPQYDNPEMRAWLTTLLSDTGIEPGDGELVFDIRPRPAPVLSVTATHRFARARELPVFTSPLRFEAGDELQVFYSCRHTPALVEALCVEAGLALQQAWVEPTGEEGVFLIRRAS